MGNAATRQLRLNRSEDAFAIMLRSSNPNDDVRDVVKITGKMLQDQGKETQKELANIQPAIQEQTVVLQTGLQTTLNVAAGLRDHLFQLRITAAFIMALCGYLIYQYWKTDAKREASNFTQAELVKNLTSAAIKSDLDEKFEAFMSTIYNLLGVVIAFQVFVFLALIAICRTLYSKPNDIGATVAVAVAELQKQDSRTVDCQSSSTGRQSVSGSNSVPKKKH